MTSSDKHLKPGQPRWNYNIQKYKPFRDVFCEKGLFSILFLACGRPEITKHCLLSTVNALKDCPLEIEWIFMENGQCEENYKLFQELQLERKVIIRQSNFGINEALNQMWTISRGEYCCILENDWDNRLPSFDFISTAADIFQERSDVGIIQLRAVFDHNEQWGRGKAEYWPWDCSEQELERKCVTRWLEKTSSGYLYLLANHPNAWNNNPCIIRKQIYRKCGPLEEAELGFDARHGESSMQDRTSMLKFITAHINQEIYFHAGQKTTPPI
jgi:hypothetical protein